MTIHITYEDAIRAMEEAVEKKGGDYVYPRNDVTGCQYTRDGEPSCLVGHALHRLGVSIEDLELLDFDGSVSIHGAQIPGVAVSPKAEVALTRAQDDQDQGVSWGAAVDSVKENHND